MTHLLTGADAGYAGTVPPISVWSSETKTEPWKVGTIMVFRDIFAVWNEGTMSYDDLDCDCVTIEEVVPQNINNTTSTVGSLNVAPISATLPTSTSPWRPLTT